MSTGTLTAAPAGRRAGDPQVLVGHDMHGVARVVAERIVETMAFRLKDEWVHLAHLAISGGLFADEVFEALADSPRRSEVDWAKVHVWWIDERFYAPGHIGRNDTHAYAAGLARVGVPEKNMHSVLGPGDTDDDLVRAAEDYGQRLRRMAPAERQVPVFDLVIVNVGPKGEVGALFPGHPAVLSDETVIAVHDAPQQSKQCVTLGYSALSVATRMWVLAHGTERAVAVGRALTGAEPSDVPAAGLRGVIETLWWLDEKAARAVPPELRGLASA